MGPDIPLCFYSQPHQPRTRPRLPPSQPPPCLLLHCSLRRTLANIISSTWTVIIFAFLSFPTVTGRRNPLLLAVFLRPSVIFSATLSALLPALLTFLFFFFSNYLHLHLQASLFAFLRLRALAGSFVISFSRVLHTIITPIGTIDRLWEAAHLLSYL